MIIYIISILIVLFCISTSMGSIYSLYYVSEKNQKKWECVNVNDEHLVIGKINNKQDAECMYIPGTAGCFILVKSEKNEENEEKCNNIINNYPLPKIDNKEILMSNFSCGKNGTNEEIWGNTGYENKNSECYKIREEKSLINEGKKWLNKTFIKRK